MRSFYIFISLFISGFTFSHDYYFSFAEIQYNKETTCLEISIKVSSHDLDTYFRKKITDVSIEKARKVDSLSPKINQFILDGFVIKQQEKQLLLREIRISDPKERPNRLYHLKEFLEIINQQEYLENDLFS